MSIRLYHVDAFTARPFAGNPAAVCILPREADPEWMQNVGREMNLSETAFLVPRDDGFHLRWFTPTVEVDLCGHATLAAAHVLWLHENHAPDEELHFHTRSGLLTARKEGDWIELNFPATPETEVLPPPALLYSLGADINYVYVGKNQFDYIVEVADEQTVRTLRPNFRELKELDARCIVVTSRSSPPYDFVSRCFGPAAGIDEDPVTGSSHCCLGPFWRQRLNKDRFLAYQASARGGEVRVRVAGERVYLGGQAVTMTIGTFECEP
ncbi:MAG: PhzF family phenazine biosynthesis protein [Acidobacteria bacterium]|nr:PhzF family phenazine biosynthesis protein [Acidobacteriota bacterium]